MSVATQENQAATHRYTSVNDMARLPYFVVNDEGRLAVKDKSAIGPIIDMHTHLALAYVRPMQVDLYAETPEMHHYLPSCCPFDLDVYVNKNMTPEHLQALKKDLTLMSLTGRGMRATHTVPNMVREMNDLGVVHSVVLPIDFPLISHNAEVAIEAARRDEHVVAYGSVHPYSWNLRDKLDAQAHGGALGIKVHPNIQSVHPNDPRARKLYRMAGDRNLVIFWHCGPVGIEPRLGRFLTQVRHYEAPIAEHPKTTFVLGHSGALQLELAIDLCNKYQNAYLEISSQSVSGIGRMVEKANPDRIVFGSDWPWYHQAIPLAKVLLATEGMPELRSKILYRNAARLLGRS